jgi:hypothetical protein
MGDHKAARGSDFKKTNLEIHPVFKAFYVKFYNYFILFFLKSAQVLLREL